MRTLSSGLTPGLTSARKDRSRRAGETAVLPAEPRRKESDHEQDDEEEVGRVRCNWSGRSGAFRRRRRGRGQRHGSENGQWSGRTRWGADQRRAGSERASGFRGRVVRCDRSLCAVHRICSERGLSSGRDRGRLGSVCTLRSLGAVHRLGAVGGFRAVTRERRVCGIGRVRSIAVNLCKYSSPVSGDRCRLGLVSVA